MKICSICKKGVEKYISTEGMDSISHNDFYHKNQGDICLHCFLKESKIRILYHLSLEPAQLDLYPRIPSNRKKGEDGKTPRICVSSSIEGCLSAVPWGGVNLAEIFNEDESALIRVYEFDVSEVGLDNIIPPDYLFQTDKVRDAYENGEHWITKRVDPSKTYLIKLRGYEEENADDFSYEDILHLESDEDFIFNPSSYGTISEVEFEVVPEESYSRNHYIYSKVKQDGSYFDLSKKEELDKWKDSIFDNIHCCYPSDHVYFDGFIKKENADYILDGILLFDSLVFDNRQVDSKLRESLTYANLA